MNKVRNINVIAKIIGKFRLKFGAIKNKDLFLHLNLLYILSNLLIINYFVK